MSVTIPRLRRKPRLGARLDRQHPLSRGLVGCWLFNEGGGNKLRDISGNANHGTLTSMDPSSDWVASQRGGALDFDGSNDYVDCGNPFPAAPSGLTVSVRARLLSDVDGDGAFLAQWSSSQGYMFYLTNTVLRPYVNGEHTNHTITVATGFQSIVMVWNGTANALYVEGNFLSSVAVSALTIPATNLRIGGYSGGYGTCQISDVRIYNRALSASEVRWLYAEPYINVVTPAYRRYFVQSGGAFRPLSLTGGMQQLSGGMRG